MQIAILLIFILVFTLYYIYNKFMNLSVSIKEKFIFLETQIFKKIEIVDKIKKLVEKEENLKDIFNEQFSYEEKELELNKQKELNIKKLTKDDISQENIILEHNYTNQFINNIKILVGEEEKLLDMGVKKENISYINSEIQLFNKIKNDMNEDRLEYNNIVNDYNKAISNIFMIIVAKIFGFQKFSLIK